jgi:hypothetical protein
MMDGDVQRQTAAATTAKRRDILIFDVVDFHRCDGPPRGKTVSPCFAATWQNIVRWAERFEHLHRYGLN